MHGPKNRNMLDKNVAKLSPSANKNIADVNCPTRSGKIPVNFVFNTLLSPIMKSVSEVITFISCYLTVDSSFEL